MDKHFFGFDGIPLPHAAKIRKKERCMKKRVLAILLSAVAVFGVAFAPAMAVGTVSGSAVATSSAAGGGSSLGSGIDVIGMSVSAVKTGRAGEKLAIGEEDFKSALAVTDFDGVRITRLPESSLGILMQAGRRVRVGQEIKRRALATLLFVPASAKIREADFGFELIAGGSGAGCRFVMRFISGSNEAPTTDGAVTVSTQSGIGLHGRMSGKDADGDGLEFIPVVFPKQGALRMTNRATGEYIYTPLGDYVGYDSFTYVVRDEYGNFSPPCEIKVNVTERLSSVVYADMTGRSEYGAAVVMDALGIMSGKTVGEICYFMPNERVTRAEFLAMAMKICGVIPTPGGSPFFDDGADVPEVYREYVAYAAVCGIVDGDFNGKALIFRPNDTVTKEEAAVIMARLLGIGAGGEEVEYSPFAEVSVHALPHVYAMCVLGIFDFGDAGFYGSDTLTRAEVAEYLYRLAIVK